MFDTLVESSKHSKENGRTGIYYARHRQHIRRGVVSDRRGDDYL